jgi:hypothetical protein
MKKLLMLLTCLLILPTPAHSKQEQNASAETNIRADKETPQRPDDDWLNVQITSPEREAIREYFHDYPQAAPEGHKPKKPKALPPGLQKKAARGCDLPPGWQKKIVRGEVLDAEVYRHATHLPVELTKRLPPAPEGTVLIKVEGKVIRLYEATRTILDVFDVGK